MLEQDARLAGTAMIGFDGNEAALEFYRALGYAEHNVVSWGKRLIKDQ